MVIFTVIIKIMQDLVGNASKSPDRDFSIFLTVDMDILNIESMFENSL